jgi:DNA-binding response OmpR family regulator
MIRKAEEIRPRILVVDDERYIGEMVCDFLNSKGYQAFYTNNGEDALILVKRVRPHIAVLDIKMSGMDGLELLSRIRRLDPVVNAIMVTGVQDDEVGRNALKLGASDLIPKPIDLEYLDTSIASKLSAMLE